MLETAATAGLLLGPVIGGILYQVWKIVSMNHNLNYSIYSTITSSYDFKSIEGLLTNLGDTRNSHNQTVVLVSKYHKCETI